MTMVVLFNN